jgi:hypothetical protein
MVRQYVAGDIMLKFGLEWMAPSILHADQYLALPLHLAGAMSVRNSKKSRSRRQLVLIMMPRH